MHYAPQRYPKQYADRHRDPNGHRPLPDEISQDLGRQNIHHSSLCSTIVGKNGDSFNNLASAKTLATTQWSVRLGGTTLSRDKEVRCVI